MFYDNIQLEIYWGPNQFGKIFFPVALHPIYFAEDRRQDPLNSPFHCCTAPRFRAVVDEERMEMLSCVTTSYHLITNEEAYEIGLELIGYVFGRDVRTVNCDFWYTTYRNRASCCIKVELQKDIIIKGVANTWKAYLLICNSYDKTSSLSYHFGFSSENMNRRNIPFGILFPKLSLDVTISHIWKRETVRKKILDAAKNKYSGRTAFDLFEEMVYNLLKIQVVDDEILPLFCRLAEIKKLDESDPKSFEVARALNSINNQCQYWISKCGSNAYAALCAIAEFAALNTGFIPFLKEPSVYQTLMGQLFEKLIHEFNRNGKDFSLDDFIGKEAREVKKQIKILANTSY